MSKQNFNILIASIAITIFGFLMDGDVKEPSVVMRFVEFFMMSGIIFIVLFASRSLYIFAKKKVNFLRG